VLLGPKAFIEQGKRWRKMLGGGMRQAGVIAAAGQYALEHNVARLADDHANAADLSSGLAQIRS
jgi:threonine aldolase